MPVPALVSGNKSEQSPQADNSFEDAKEAARLHHVNALYARHVEGEEIPGYEQRPPGSRSGKDEKEKTHFIPNMNRDLDRKMEEAGKIDPDLGPEYPYRQNLEQGLGSEPPRKLANIFFTGGFHTLREMLLTASPKETRKLLKIFTTDVVCSSAVRKIQLTSDLDTVLSSSSMSFEKKLDYSERLQRMITNEDQNMMAGAAALCSLSQLPVRVLQLTPEKNDQQVNVEKKASGH